MLEKQHGTVSDAIIYSTLGQLYRLKKLISNIVNYWLSIWNYYQIGKIARFVFEEIVARRVLPIVEVLHMSFFKSFTKNYVNEVTLILESIWTYIDKAGWAARKDVIMYSTQLRIAKETFSGLLRDSNTFL